MSSVQILSLARVFTPKSACQKSFQFPRAQHIPLSKMVWFSLVLQECLSTSLILYHRYLMLPFLMSY